MDEDDDFNHFPLDSMMASVARRVGHVLTTKAMVVVMTMMMTSATAITTATTQGLIIVEAVSQRNRRRNLAWSSWPKSEKKTCLGA